MRRTSIGSIIYVFNCNCRQIVDWIGSINMLALSCCKSILSESDMRSLCDDLIAINPAL